MVEQALERNDISCKAIGIWEVIIKMHDGVKALTDVHHVMDLKKNLIYFCTFDMMAVRWYMNVLEGVLVVIKGKEVGNLSYLRGNIGNEVIFSWRWGWRLYILIIFYKGCSLRCLVMLPLEKRNLTVMEVLNIGRCGLHIGDCRYANYAVLFDTKFTCTNHIFIRKSLIFKGWNRLIWTNKDNLIDCKRVFFFHFTWFYLGFLGKEVNGARTQL